MYLFWALVLVALPSVLGLYHGNTGKFLVSTALTEHSPFEKTVIYIVRHNFFGAYGVIINKPVEKPEGLTWNVEAYYGGPILDHQSPSLLIENEEQPHGFIIASLEQLRSERPDLIRAMEEGKNADRLPFFSGYASWAPLQLNLEIVRGAWAVVDYDPKLMFDLPRGNVWEKAMEKVLKERPAASGGA